MPTYNVVSDGTLTLGGRVFQDFADDDISAVSYETDTTTLKTGKNGNTIYSRNEQGRNGQLVIRLIKGSSDDQFMQGKMAADDQDFASSELLFGEFALRIGDGAQNIVTDVISLTAGKIMRRVDSKENVSGDTAQGVSIYTLKFADAKRSIR